jgi:glycosyltransferase involved in cell wall biosynthesis
MRILHVNKFLYRRGGAEGYMLDVAERQRDAGHEVKVFGMDHPDNDAEHVLGPLPSHVEFEPMPEGTADRARLLGRMIWSRESRAALARAVDSWRPDVIHCHNIYHQLSPSVLAVARDRDIPVVLTMHDYKLACPTYQFLDRGEVCTACVDGGLRQAVKRGCKDGSRAASGAAALEVWLHRRTRAYEPVRRFIAPSAFLADQIARAGVYPDRIRVLDNLTDVDSTAVQTEPGRGAVFAGRLAYEKGVDTLIRAVGEVAGDRVADQPLLDVAGDGPDRAALERLAAEVAPGLVRFHGRLPKDELMALVRRAAVSVVPSRWYENQPLSVLESFSAGVPVLATAMGGLPELVQEAETGWLVGVDDPTTMGKVLLEAVDDPVEAHRRGRVARHLAERRFSPAVHLESLAAIYQEAGVR